MDKPMPNWAFAGMSFIFKIRDAIRPPEKVLAEVDIRPGYQVLDYGCGPGALTIAAARMVGAKGKVVALDLHPKAIESVRAHAAAAGIKNIQPVLAGSPHELGNEQFDVVLLYDIFHMMGEQEKALRELHRILKPNKILSFSDHHMKEAEIQEKMTSGGFFSLKERGKRTYTFAKIS